MFKNRRFIYFIAGLCLLISTLAVYFVWKKPAPKEVAHHEIQQWVANRSIFETRISPTGFDGIYTLEGLCRSDGATNEFNTVTHLDAATLAALLAQPGVKVDLPTKSAKAQVLSLLPPLLIAGLVLYLVFHQLNIGNSKKRHEVRHRPNARFNDVAGIEEAKAEVQEIVDFLRHPEKYRRLGAHLPKGILLIGPPGTGKTMLAKAIAGEANAHFFSAHGSDFNEVFVGVGARRVRQIFSQARKNRPAIIFIDEIDCLGKKRTAEGHNELQQTNNALLAEMDGFESSDGIVVIGATNRPEDLDLALTRPGRFDRKVFVPLPDRRGRRAILDVHAKDKPIQDKDRTLDILAQTTVEMSGADLASLVNEAAILCAQRNLDTLALPELEEARDKVRWGRERKSMVLCRDEREIVAYHEAGHTVINLHKSLLPPLYKVSIIPRGGALGVTTLLPVEDQHLHSKIFLKDELVVLMGGRAAEKVFFGDTTNGAGGDLENSKKIARKMIHDWGMGEKMYYQAEQGAAEKEINLMLEAADREALSIIEQKKDQVAKLAQALLRHETLTREQVVNLLFEDQEPFNEAEAVQP